MRSLHLAVERASTFFDTALAYGDGHSEQLVGRLLREVVRAAARRDQGAAAEPPLAGRGAAIPVEEVFPGDYIVALHRAEPPEPRRRDDRRAPAARLVGGVGRARATGSRRSSG